MVLLAELLAFESVDRVVTGRRDFPPCDENGFERLLIVILYSLNEPLRKPLLQTQRWLPRIGPDSTEQGPI